MSNLLTPAHTCKTAQKPAQKRQSWDKFGTRLRLSLVSFFQIKIAPRFGSNTIADLGYPTREQLASVGLEGRAFLRKYVFPVAGLKSFAYGSPERFAGEVLRRFWSDFPQLAMRERNLIRSFTARIPRKHECN